MQGEGGREPSFSAVNISFTLNNKTGVNWLGRKILALILLVTFMMSTAVPITMAEQINMVTPAQTQGVTLTPETNEKAVLNENGKSVNQAKLAGVSLPFIENKGQIQEDGVRFYADTFAGRVYITDRGITYALPAEKGTGESWAFEESFAGKTVISPAAAGKSESRVSSFKGTDKSKWQKNLTTYESITLGEIYPGIEVSLKAYGDNVEKLFTVAPGRDPAKIAVKVKGVNSLSVNETGELVMKTELGEVKLTAPIAYQEINGVRKDVDVAYKVEDTIYGFTLGAYDPAYPVIIDPLLAATYLGGSGNDNPYPSTTSLALDEDGNVYVTGVSSGSFPVKLGRGNAHAGGNDIFVAKISRDLTKLYSATYIGGNAADVPYALALFDGDVYIAGYTASAGTSFPVTIGTSNGGNDCFVLRLNGSLAELKAAAIFGGVGADTLYDMKVRSNNGIPDVIIGGFTASTGYPTTSGAVQSTKMNGSSAAQGFVTRLDGSKLDGSKKADGSSYEIADIITASTFLGGTSGTGATNLTKLDFFEDGRILVGGYTANNTFPTTTGAYDTSFSGGSDAFLTILDSSLSQITVSTLVGNSTTGSNEQFRDLKIYKDFSGMEHIYGYGFAMPNTFGASDITAGKTTIGGSYDVFVIKISSDLTTREALALLGGSGMESPYGFDVDENGNVYVSGETTSIDFPVTTGQRFYNTSKEGFITKFNSNLNIQASTYLGGAGTSDSIYTLCLDGEGNLYALGYTNSTDIPTTAKALQGIYGGGSYDAYIAKLSADNLYAPDEDITAPEWPDEEDVTATDVTPSALTLLWPEAEDESGVEGYLISGKDVEDADYTVIDSVYGDVTSYRVTTLEPLDTANILNKGLIPGHSYSFKIEAVDHSGNWSQSLVSNEVVLPVSNAPYWNRGAELEADDIQTDRLTLLWPPAEDDGEVARYILYVGSQEITAPEYVYNVGEAVYSYTVTNLTPNTEYNFSVFAEDEDGYRSNPGLNLVERTAAPPDITAPYWTSGGVVGAAAEQIVTSISSSMIRWTPPTDDRGVTQYRIRVYQGMQASGTPLREEIVPVSEMGTEVINGVTKKTFEIKGLQRLTQYLFVIQAGDAANNWSEIIRNVSSAQGMELILPDYPTDSGEAGGGAGGFTNTFLISANLCTINSGISYPVVTKATGDEVLAKGNLENATGVSLNPTIRLYFYRNMSAGMPGNAEYIKLYKKTSGGEQEVPINVFFINAANTSSERRYLFFNPVRPLSPGTQYRLYLNRELAPNKGTLKMDYDKNINFTTASPISGNITVEPERKNVVIDHTTPSGAVITVPDTISDAVVDVSTFLDIPVNGQVTAAAVPAMTVESMISPVSSTMPVQLQIPAGISISGTESWPGSLNLPTAKPNNSVLVVPDSGKTASVNAVVEIGYGDTPLTFDKAVRIVFPGQAGKDIGYVRGLNFSKISTVLAADSQAAGDALPAGGEGKMNVGSDLVVWTKHFTQFVIYTQTAGSGSGSDTTKPVWPSGAEITSAKTSTTEADVSWTAATDNVGVVGYKIFLSSSSAPAATVGGGTTSVHLSGLPTGPHTVSVVAVDGAGNQSVKLTGQLGGETAGFSITKVTALDPNPSNLVLHIDLSNGLNEDTLVQNLRNISLINKTTGAQIALADYEYVKQGDNWSEEEKIRRLNLTYTGLEKDVVYKLTIGAGFEANNGNTLGKSHTWEMTSTVTGVIAEAGSGTTTSSGTAAGNISTVGIPVPANTLSSTDVQVTTEDGIKTVKVKENAANWDTIDLVKLSGQSKGQVKMVLPAGLLSGSQITKPVEVYYGPVKVKVPVKPLEEAKGQQKGITLVLNTQDGDISISGLSNETYVYQSGTIEVKGSLGDGTLLTEELEISFGIDVNKLSEGQKQGLGAYLYDEKAQSWQYVGGAIGDNLFTTVIPAAGKVALLTYDRNFSDLSGHWAANDVTYLVRKHIVTGQSEDRFVPNASITRAEFAALLSKVLDLKPVNGESRFKDVKPDDWYAGVVNAAAEKGLILGSNGHFDPNRQITREEMAVLLMKMYEYKGNQITETEQPASFKDGQSISGWAAEAVGQAKELGFISGRSDGTFAPRNSATRAEVCTMLVRLLEKVS